MNNQHLEPGAPLYVQQLDEKVDNVHALVSALVKSVGPREEIREYEVSVGGNTDATGFLRASVELPQGMSFYVHRINLTAINPASGLPYTPAAPYTSGWVGIFRGEPATNLQNMFDFAPPSPGANVFPQISTDGNKQAAVIRGERLFLQVTAGPALAQVIATILGRLART